MVSDPDPRPESPTGTIDGGSARRSIGLVDFDWTDAERRIRRIDLPALEPRSDGLWMGDNDGWRHLGVFIDRFGPTAGDRLD
jgi:hypothetical protein